MFSPDPKILGKILLLQSSLHAAPNERRLGEQLCYTLKSIPGITYSALYIDEQFVASEPIDSPHFPTWPLPWEEIEKCLSQNQHFKSSLQLLSLRSNKEKYGYLALKIADSEELSTYLPFIENTVNFIALLLENRRQQTDLRNLNLNLEEQIVKRTKALHESEQLFRNTFENATIGICLTDISGETLLANPAMAEILGYKLNELEGVNHKKFTHVKDMDITMTARQTLLEGEKQSTIFEKRYIHKSGRTVWVKIGTFLLRNTEGIPQYFITHIEDVTYRKIAEEQNKNLEEQLRQAHKMEAIGTLAGGIAHDFNNILAAILGFADLAKEETPFYSPVTYHLEQVIKAGNRAKELIKHILSFSRKEAKQRSPIQIQPLIEETLKLLRASIPTTIDIEHDYGSNCEIIMGNPSQINQVLMNLCTNAAQSMDENGGLLEVKLDSVQLTSSDLLNHPNLPPGDYVHLSVKDTGTGIDHKYLDRIFDPYFTTKDVGQGSGMGLAVVTGIVRSHEGLITVASTPSKGTAFNVYFPKLVVHTQKEKSKSETLPRGTERILIVDDEVSMVDVTQRQLEHLGYQVTVKTSSNEALKLFQSQPESFDIVLSDQTMPEMTGEKLAKKLLEIRPNIPIIICTGYSAKLDAEKANRVGIRAFIMKPVDKRELARTVRDILENDSEKS